MGWGIGRRPTKVPFFKYSRTSFSVVTLLPGEGRGSGSQVRTHHTRGHTHGGVLHSPLNAELLNLWYQNMQQSLDGLDRQFLFPVEQLGGERRGGEGGEGRGGKGRRVGGKTLQCMKAHAQAIPVSHPFCCWSEVSWNLWFNQLGIVGCHPLC